LFSGVEFKNHEEKHQVSPDIDSSSKMMKSTINNDFFDEKFAGARAS
jgi:hypothetical protein